MALLPGICGRDSELSGCAGPGAEEVTSSLTGSVALGKSLYILNHRFFMVFL